jgi:hypothetical protein
LHKFHFYGADIRNRFSSVPLCGRTAAHRRSQGSISKYQEQAQVHKEEHNFRGHRRYPVRAGGLHVQKDKRLLRREC